MSAFSATIEAYLSGRKVNMRPLALFDFRDGEEAWWGGEYDLVSGGKTWKGLSRWVNVEGLDQANTLDSSAMTFSLSGVEATVLAIATSSDRANYVNRLVTVYMQFFDEDWQTLDAPWALKAGLMDDMQISRSQAEKDDGSVTWTRSLRLTAQNIFFGRGVAPYSLWTDRDQQKRYPGQGDKGLQFLPVLQDTDIPVPWH